MGSQPKFKIETCHKRNDYFHQTGEGRRLPYFKQTQNKAFPVMNRKKHQRKRGSESA